jgi:hypothetical protein
LLNKSKYETYAAKLLAFGTQEVQNWAKTSLKFYHASKHQDIRFKKVKVLQQKNRAKSFTIP